MDLARRPKAKYYKRFKVDKHFNWIQRTYLRNRISPYEYDYDINKYYNWFYIEDKNHFDKTDLNIILKLYLDRLDQRKQFLIIHHYGLFDSKEFSCEQFADILNISQTRVRQVIDQALRRLRKLIYTGYNAKDKHNLRSFLN